MNAPERVLMTIEHEEPDRVPAWESAFTSNTITEYYGIDSKKKGYKYQYELFRRIGIDICVAPVSLFPRKSVKRGKGFIDEYGRIMQFEYYEKDGTEIMGYIGGHFKSFEDYESWEQPDPYLPTRVQSFKLGKRVQEEMNDEVFSVPATGALMECTWEGFGLETFSRIIRKRKQAKKIFDDRGEFTLEMVKILAENDAKLVILWDDYGFKNGLFMRPAFYRDYIFPWLKRICETAHKRDCKILLHSDGDLMEIFGDIVECGVDVINPIEPTTANPDYDIFKLNELYGDRTTFCGNVSPIMLAMGKISEIKNYSKKLIREIAPGGGYIFSSGHSINPAVTVDRFEAMQNVRRKYGIYPIEIPN